MCPLNPQVEEASEALLDPMAKQEKFSQRVRLKEKTNILGRHNLQSAGSSARFHGERGARAGAGRPPWTGSLCERPGSLQCWRTKPEPQRTQTCVLVTV